MCISINDIKTIGMVAYHTVFTRNASHRCELQGILGFSEFCFWKIIFFFKFKSIWKNLTHFSQKVVVNN